MPRVTNLYTAPSDLTLGVRITDRVPEFDQRRQRAEVEEILARFRSQPGVILADEVGMGKTFVALAVAHSVVRSARGPVVFMVPANLIDKWKQDVEKFCDLYLDGRQAVCHENASDKELTRSDSLRYGTARHSVELLRLLDDPPRVRCHFIFLAQGAMSRSQTDRWVRLALIAEALKVHGRGRASRLIQVKEQIYRFLGELLRAVGQERAHDLGEDLWRQLLKCDPSQWKDICISAIPGDKKALVPKTVVRSLATLNLKPLATALEEMPVRASSKERVSERIRDVRAALQQIETSLWTNVLAQARWWSPLLVMDEAHHLKNPETALARQLQSSEGNNDLRTGDSALARAFERMLFLTATPFQLGHAELVQVLTRFGDVKWDASKLGPRKDFTERLRSLEARLNDFQRTAIGFQRCWSRLIQEDCDTDVEIWWRRIAEAQRETLNHRQRAVVDSLADAERCHKEAQFALQPWILRHNKDRYWGGTDIARRRRLDGSAIRGGEKSIGLSIPSEQVLPFFLAARGAAQRGEDLLDEALCSSYEAFRFTRNNPDAEKDSEEGSNVEAPDRSHSGWYLQEFDHAFGRSSGSTHPKLDATVQRVVDLWEAGEKVLVFAFFRHTCRALRIHISGEIERRMVDETEKKRLGDVGLDNIQRRFFDDTDAPGRRAIDHALEKIVSAHQKSLDARNVPDDERSAIIDVMRRFLRVETTLVRCFPLKEINSLTPEQAVAVTLDHADGSGVSWRKKLDGFVSFLATNCSPEERASYLDAAKRTQTGGIRVKDEDDIDEEQSRVTLANVQVATGVTRREKRSRLMLAFNTPFFPDILICSQVMGEGVDLQRYCRHVIHHDLAWNPSTIEQRTGRVDRLGCISEGRHPIMVYLPYLAGASDERQYKVMTDRERWFRIVMGNEKVAELIRPDATNMIPLPEAISSRLSFRLGLRHFESSSATVTALGL